MTPKDRHLKASSAAAEEGCVCTGPKPSVLCGNERGRGLTCTRARGHAAPHVACAGELGPHAIASWATDAELRA